jgi:hypothetical protein
VNVIVVDAGERQAGVETATAPFVVFLQERDEPAEDFVSALVQAQASSGADIVSCGLRLSEPPSQHLFLGDPGGLGLLSNSFGTSALIRRSLLEPASMSTPTEVERDWPLLARLYLDGAHVVSVPLPLLNRREPPASVSTEAADALAVVEAYERALPASLRSLARLAAGLAAASERARAPSPDGAFRRAWAVGQSEGAIGIVRRLGRRLLKA